MQTYLVARFALTEQDRDDIQNAIRVLSDVIDGLAKAGTNDGEITLFRETNECLVRLEETGTIE